MSASSVIPALDILKNSQSGLFPGGKFPMIDPFRFHCLEEAFGYSIIESSGLLCLYSVALADL
jgi:hypothetical protein